MPKISIIMPVYNTGNVLKTTINKVISQTFRDWELIIVDDGSTDVSSKICDDFASLDFRIKVYHKTNGGICDARNFGLFKSTGDYITFCDHDDEYLPNLLDVVINSAEKFQADAVKFRNYQIIDGQQPTCIHKLSNEEIFYGDIRNAIFPMLRWDLLGTIWTFIYKRDILQRFNLLFDVNFKHGGEDLDFNLRVFNFLNNIVVLPNILYIHYIRSSLSTSSILHNDMLYYMFPKIFDDLNMLVLHLNINLKKNKNEYLYFFSNESLTYVAHYLLLKNRDKNFIKERLSVFRSKNLLINGTTVKSSLFFFVLMPKQAYIHILIKFKLYSIVYYSGLAKLYLNRKL